MPTAFVVARFVRTYGAGAYHGAWPTADGVVPARLFYVLVAQIPALLAGERIEGIEAARMGQLLAEVPKDASVKAEVRRLVRTAVPLIYPPLEE